MQKRRVNVCTGTLTCEKGSSSFAPYCRPRPLLMTTAPQQSLCFRYSAAANAGNRLCYSFAELYLRWSARLRQVGYVRLVTCDCKPGWTRLATLPVVCCSSCDSLIQAAMCSCLRHSIFPALHQTGTDPDQASTLIKFDYNVIPNDSFATPRAST